MHTLVVQAADKSGRPDNGDEIFVFNADNPLLFEEIDEFASTFCHGTARFSMPAGHYWAVADFLTGRTSGNRPAYTQRLVVLPQFTVSGRTTTVPLSARAATSEASFTTPRPTRPGFTIWTIARYGPHKSRSGVESNSLFGPLWISPLRTKHTIGTLISTTETTRSSPSAGGASYYYLLDYVSPPDVIPPQHFLVNPASLATVHQRFFSTARQQISWEVAGGDQEQIHDPFTILGVSGRRTIPGTQTLYFTGGTEFAWKSLSETVSAPLTGDASRPYSLLAGQNLTENFGEVPLHPQPNVQLAASSFAAEFPQMPSAFRSGNDLFFVVNPFSDSSNDFGHVNLIQSVGHYALRQNGKQIADGSFFGFVHVKVSPQPSSITLSASSTEKHPAGLSPHTFTVWTLRTAAQPRAVVSRAWHCYDARFQWTQRCAVQPLLTLDYQVSRLGLDGVTPAGQQAIFVHVGHIQLARPSAIVSATAQVSFDAGKTWQPATVTRVSAGNYRVTFSAPASGDVTLRFMASDAAGGSISDTITNAYAVGPPAIP